MSPNAWKSASVFLIAAVAVWYASFHDAVGVFLGLAVAWRFLIGDLVNQEATNEGLEGQGESTRYPCQGSGAFSPAMAAAARNQGAENCLLDMACAEITETYFSLGEPSFKRLPGAWDRVHVGDKLVRVSDVLEMLELLVEVETALDRDSRAVAMQ